MTLLLRVEALKDRNDAMTDLLADCSEYLVDEWWADRAGERTSTSRLLPGTG